MQRYWIPSESIYDEAELEGKPRDVEVVPFDVAQAALQAKDARIKELERQVATFQTNIEDNGKLYRQLLNEKCDLQFQLSTLTQELARLREESAQWEKVSLLALLNTNRELKQELARVKGERDEAVRSKNDCVIDLYRKLDKLDDLNLKLKQAHADLLVEARWPNVIAPAQYENPALGWEDPKLPDFKLIWKLAREVGYAVGIHGSLKRDVDLIAAPWTDEAVGNYGLIEHLCKGLPAKWLRHGEAPCDLHKPHGRVAVTLQIDGYYKPIDLSIMPRAQAFLRTHEAQK